MPPNAELGTGQAFAREAFSGMIDAGLTSETKTIAASAAGGVGYHAGTYTMYAPDGSVADRGKFIEGFTKVNGEWKIQLTGYVRTFEETWPRDGVEGLELTANRFEATEDP